MVRKPRNMRSRRAADDGSSGSFASTRLPSMDFTAKLPRAFSHHAGADPTSTSSNVDYQPEGITRTRASPLRLLTRTFILPADGLPSDAAVYDPSGWTVPVICSSDHCSSACGFADAAFPAGEGC